MAEQNLADLPVSELSKGWILCKDETGETVGKEPLIICATRCKKADKCQTFNIFPDAISMVRDAIIEQDNENHVIAFNKLVDVLVKSSGYESFEGNKISDEETEPINDEPAQEPPAKKKKKKKKVSAKKTDKKDKQGEEPTVEKKDDEVAAETEDPAEEAPNVTIDAKPERYIILPLKVEDPNLSGFVTKDQIEDIVGKFHEEGVECSVFRLGKDIKKKSKYDYLVCPVSKGEPKLIDEEDLNDIINEYAASDIDLRIYQVGKEFTYQKQIIIKEVV